MRGTCGSHTGTDTVPMSDRRRNTAAMSAYIKTRTTTHRQRQRLKDDNELVQQLPEGSTARRHLQASIEERLIRASYQEYYNSTFTMLVIFFIMFAVVGAAFATAAVIDAEPAIRGAVILIYAYLWTTAYLLMAFIVVAAVAYDRRQAQKRRTQYFQLGYYPDPYDASPRRRRLRRIIARTNIFRCSIRRLTVRSTAVPDET